MDTLRGHVEFLLSSVGIFFSGYARLHVFTKGKSPGGIFYLRYKMETRVTMRFIPVKVPAGFFSCFGKNGKQATKCKTAFHTGKSLSGIFSG